MHNRRLLFIIFYCIFHCLALGLYTTSPQARPLLVQSRQGTVPIYQIQANALVSPYAQTWLDTYGLVTGVIQDGFYLQDPVGDGDLTTSDGIFVYTRSVPTVNPGQCVAVTRAYVDEFYEKTELSRFKSISQDSRCPTAAVSPVVIPMASMGKAPATLFEPYEGMFVEIHNLAGLSAGAYQTFCQWGCRVGADPRAAAPLPGR